NDIRSQKLYCLRQQRKWFFDIVVKERIGKEEFLNKLLKTGKETDLYVLSAYPELIKPLAQHLFEQLDQSELVNPEQHGSFLRYELMNSE
ncbi:unnamed protein product, partial [Rotaria sp. Silwood2]